MTPEDPGRLYRPPNLEVFEDKDDHTKSFVVVCRHVVEIGREGIESRLFEVGNAQLSLVEKFVAELQNTMEYRRRKRQGLDISISLCMVYSLDVWMRFSVFFYTYYVWHCIF